MTTQTGMNSMIFHSSTRINDETQNPLILNQSLDRMEMDDQIHEVTTTMNEYKLLSHSIENGINNHEGKNDICHQR